jgi:CRISPR-associated endonuclease Csn1
LKSGKEAVFFGMVRVYQEDLIGHVHEDLFLVNLPQQSISLRAAEPRLREALSVNRAEYVGWLVEGDELTLDMSSQRGKGAVGELLEQYPTTTKWVVGGFYSQSRLRLRPRYLAAEGLSGDCGKEIVSIIARPGWTPSISVIFQDCAAVVVRRDVFGRPRLESARGLPVCWRPRGLGNVQVNTSTTGE